MKKTFLIALCLILLWGCGARETMETVQDDLEILPVMVQPREITVEIPPEAEAAAVDSGYGRMYLCEDYELSVETREGGDLNSTLQAITGHGKDEISLIETRGDGWRRYDFVWTTQEAGAQVGRGAILDDGNYHYCLSVLRPAENVENSQVVWSRVFRSLSIA